jgi:RsiW-degrading membrane proteinase PrsW (M82 family)
MTWIHYLLIIWLVCAILSLLVRFYPKEDRDTSFFQVLIIAAAGPFILLMIAVLKVGTFIEELFDRKKRKAKEQEELEELSRKIAEKKKKEQLLNSNDEIRY